MQKGSFPDSKNFTINLKNVLLKYYGKSYGNSQRLHLTNKRVTKLINRVIQEKSLMYPDTLLYILDSIPDFSQRKE